MRVLVIDSENMALDFVLRCTAAGHHVRWFKYEKPGKPIRDGEGFKGFEIVDDWRPSMGWAKEGLILNTGNWRYVHELDRYREHGFKVFGPTVASSKLEIERSVGMDAMKAAGIDVPPYQVFDSLQDAAKFARKSDRAWVHKPMGDEDDKGLTYVGKDPADLVAWIERRINKGVKLKGQVMLQEKVDCLCEIGVSGWFGPDGFLPDKWQVCIEHKKLYPGEVGQNTGEQGSVCQYEEVDKLANEMLVPMVGALRAAGHRGDFCIGAMVDTAGKAHPLEYTARLGYPAWFVQVASHKGDPAQWMRDLLDGKDTLKVSYDVAIGVVLSQPRYPHNDSPPEMVEGNPIKGLEDTWNDMHLSSAMIGRGPKMKDGKVQDGPVYQTTGEWVACATGLGKTVTQARKRVYGTIGEVHFSNMGYRDDIGEKLQKALPKMHSAGYLINMKYE